MGLDFGSRKPKSGVGSLGQKVKTDQKGGAQAYVPPWALKSLRAPLPLNIGAAGGFGFASLRSGKMDKTRLYPVRVNGREIGLAYWDSKSNTRNPRWMIATSKGAHSLTRFACAADPGFRLQHDADLVRSLRSVARSKAHFSDDLREVSIRGVDFSLHGRNLPRVLHALPEGRYRIDGNRRLQVEARLGSPNVTATVETPRTWFQAARQIGTLTTSRDSDQALYRPISDAAWKPFEAEAADAHDVRMRARAQLANFREARLDMHDRATADVAAALRTKSEYGAMSMTSDVRRLTIRDDKGNPLKDIESIARHVGRRGFAKANIATSVGLSYEIAVYLDREGSLVASRRHTGKLGLATYDPPVPLLQALREAAAPPVVLRAVRLRDRRPAGDPRATSSRPSQPGQQHLHPSGKYVSDIRISQLGGLNAAAANTATAPDGTYRLIDAYGQHVGFMERFPKRASPVYFDIHEQRVQPQDLGDLQPSGNRGYGR